MKRILILLGSLAILAALGISAVHESDEPGILSTLSGSQDTSVVVRRVFEGPFPEFWGNGPSPDGRYVTQTDWETGDLAILDLLTGTMRRITDKTEGGWETSYAYSESARFSPDGRRIAYSWFTEPGTYELRVINVDGTQPMVVARAGIRPDWPRPWEWWPDLHGWSPDGEHILATLFFEGENRWELTLLSVADGSREVIRVREEPDAYAAISPDGRYLAYDAKGDVFVRPLAGGDAVAIASGPSEDVLAGWTEEGGVLYLSDRDLTEGVWRIPVRDGRPTDEAVLVAGDLWGMQPMGIAGNSLVYGIATEAPQVHIVSLDLNRNRLIGTPAPVEPQVRESTFPSWSPDGQKILFFGERGSDTRLLLRSTAGSGTQDITPAEVLPVPAHALWSPDGHQVLFYGSERESLRHAFFAYTPATGEIEYVFSSEAYATGGRRVYQETFSSDWGTVYLPFTQGSGGPFELLRVDLDENLERTLTSRPARSQADVSSPARRFYPSPDDRSLAFWEFTDPDTARMLRVISAEGGEARTLLTEAWSGDEDLPVCPAGRYVPLWTSDGRHVLAILQDTVPKERPFPPNPCKLYKVPVQGGDPIYLGAIPEHRYQWDLSPDDNRLAFSTGDTRGEIWILQGLQ
jgi:Tol biopolymer transport system component